MIVTRWSFFIFCLFIIQSCVSSNKVASTEHQSSENIEFDYSYFENLSDESVQDWFRQQDVYSDSVFLKLSFVDSLASILTARKTKRTIITSSETVLPDSTLIYYKWDDDKGYSLLHINKHNSENELIFDVKELGDDYYISYFKASWNNKLLALGISTKNNEGSNIYVLDLESYKLLPDFAKNSFPNGLGGIEWLPDNSGFIYTYVPILDPNHDSAWMNSKGVVCHISNNKFIITDFFSCNNLVDIACDSSVFPISYYTNPNNNYVLGALAYTGVRNRDVYIKDIRNKESNWKKLWSAKDEIVKFELIGNDLYYFTTLKNPYKDLCHISLDSVNFENPNLLASGSEAELLEDFIITQDGIYYTKLRNGTNAKLFFNDLNKNYQISLPHKAGSIELYSMGSDDSAIWIKTRGWINATKRYKYEEESFIKNNISDIYDDSYLEECVVKEIDVVSHDGTKVPLTIIHNKELKMDGSNSLFIDTYGSYGYIEEPGITDLISGWVENNGVYAIAHVRGGGEKGNEWHKDGIRENKSNSWKDLIACTKYMVDQNYTSPSKVVAYSASAGGIVVGRAITEMPNLFAAAIIEVGFFDLINHENSPSGKADTKEFGTMSDSLEAIFVRHNDVISHINPNTKYPAVYTTIGMNDLRVEPWHGAKFVAKLQNCSISGKPIILDVDFEGGHGAGETFDEYTYRNAQILAFAFWQTGHPKFQSNQ